MFFYIISIMWTSIIKIILDRYTFYKRDIKMLHPSACTCSSIILWHFHFWLFSSIVWLPKFAVFFVSSMFSIIFFHFASFISSRLLREEILLTSPLQSQSQLMYLSLILYEGFTPLWGLIPVFPQFSFSVNPFTNMTLVIKYLTD